MSPERAKYIKEMLKLSDQDEPREMEESNEGMIRVGTWTCREQLSWLQGYDTEEEDNRNKPKVHRWKAFARRLREEFGILRSSVQCSKQVITQHTSSTCRFKHAYHDINTAYVGWTLN